MGRRRRGRTGVVPHSARERARATRRRRAPRPRSSPLCGCACPWAAGAGWTSSPRLQEARPSARVAGSQQAQALFKIEVASGVGSCACAAAGLFVGWTAAAHDLAQGVAMQSPRPCPTDCTSTHSKCLQQQVLAPQRTPPPTQCTIPPPAHASTPARLAPVACTLLFRESQSFVIRRAAERSFWCGTVRSEAARGVRGQRHLHRPLGLLRGTTAASAGHGCRSRNSTAQQRAGRPVHGRGDLRTPRESFSNPIMCTVRRLGHDQHARQAQVSAHLHAC